MSELWEEAIQKWYTDSRTSHLDYLDLAEDKSPSRKELAHNLAVVYDRTCLSSRVNLRNFKLLLEKTQQLDEKIQKLERATKTLSALFKESKPLTKTEVRELVIEIAKQPKVIEEEALKLTQDLDRKILRVEALLTKIEGQIFGWATYFPKIQTLTKRPKGNWVYWSPFTWFPKNKWLLRNLESSGGCNQATQHPDPVAYPNCRRLKRHKIRTPDHSGVPTSKSSPFTSHSRRLDHQIGKSKLRPYRKA